MEDPFKSIVDEHNSAPVGEAYDPFKSIVDEHKAQDTGAGLIGDAVIGLGKGVLQTPDIVTGALDVVPGLFGLDRPFDRATDAIGEFTGFQPGKIAEQTQYSGKLQTQLDAENQIWNNPEAGALDTAQFYASNPALIVNKLSESAAPMALGGVASKFLPAALGLPARGAIGEGAVIAGSTQQGIDESVDPQTRSLAALGTGVLGTAIGFAGGKIADRLDVFNPETVMARYGVSREVAEAAAKQIEPNIAKRILKGGGIEAGEEAAQTYFETGLQNVAEGKEFHEGITRALVEGAITGGVMGAGFNVPGSIRGNTGPLTRAASNSPLPTGEVDERAGVGENVDGGIVDANGIIPGQEDNGIGEGNVDNAIPPGFNQPNDVTSGQASDTNTTGEAQLAPTDPNNINVLEPEKNSKRDILQQQKDHNIRYERTLNRLNELKAKENPTLAELKIIARQEFFLNNNPPVIESGLINEETNEATDSEITSNDTENIGLNPETGELNVGGTASDIGIAAESINVAGEQGLDGASIVENGVTEDGAIGNVEQVIDENSELGSTDSNQANIIENNTFIGDGIGEVNDNITNTELQNEQESALGSSDGTPFLNEAQSEAAQKPTASEAQSETRNTLQNVSESQAENAQTSAQTTETPRILTQTQEQYVDQELESQGIRPKAPGAAKAKANIVSQYEIELEQAQVSLPYEQYKALPENKDIPDNLARQAYDQIREEYGLTSDGQVTPEKGDISPISAINPPQSTINPPNETIRPQDNNSTRVLDGNSASQQSVLDSEEVSKKSSNLRRITGKENVVDAIKKLGGITKNIANESGFSDTNDKRLFNNGVNSKTPDEMAEALREIGFDSAIGGNEVETMITDQLDGSNINHYTAEGAELYAERQAQERYNDEEMQLSLRIDSLLDEAKEVDSVYYTQLQDFIKKGKLHADNISSFEGELNEIIEDKQSQAAEDSSKGFGDSLGEYTEEDIQKREESAKQQERSRVESENINKQQSLANSELENLENELLGKGIKNIDLFDTNPLQKIESSKTKKSTTNKFSKAIDKDVKNLAIIHNLSSENLAHADKIGGLSVPSIAVINKDFPLSGYGEISLIGSKEQFAPSKSTKIFDADIYSPRYPSVDYIINQEGINAANNSLSNEAKVLAGSNEIFRSDMKDRGLDSLKYSEPLQYEYLKSLGKEPKLKYKALTKIHPTLRKYAKSHIDSRALVNDSEFVKLFKKTKIKEYEVYKDKDKDVYNHLITGFQENDNNIIVANIIRSDFSYKLENYYNEKKNGRHVDVNSVGDSIRKRIKGEEHLYKKWIDKNYGNLITGSEIFNGFTPSGKRRYLNHNLDNVVKLMTKELRGGESFNYGGAAPLRSHLSKQFKKISEIQKNRGKIVSEKEMDSIKDQSNKAYSEIESKLNGQITEYADGAKDLLEQVAKSGWYGVDAEFGEISGSLKDEVNEFLNILKNYPTEYFEGKVQRAVNISEFEGAVVPLGKEYAEAITLLKKNGIINIRRYKHGDSESRAKAVNGFKKLLFSKSNKATTTSAAQQITNLLPKRVQNRNDVTVVQSKEDIPAHVLSEGETHSDLEGVQAIYHEETNQIYLIADVLNKDNVNSVLTHELYHYAERNDPKFKKQLAKINKQFANRFKLAGKGVGTKEEIAAYKRVVDAETPKQFEHEEFRAYLVEQYSTNPKSLSETIRRAIKDFIAHIRAMLIRQGFIPKNITSADLTALAKDGYNRLQPVATSFNGLQNNDVTIASKQGYKGNDPQEAKEWSAAVNAGLDMSHDARMKRAKDMGFDVDTSVYHGTATDFEAFDPDKAIGTQFWSTTDRIAIEKGEVGAQAKGVIKEMFHRIEKPAGWGEYDQLNTDEMIARGFDGVALEEDGETTYIAFDPSQYRSINAAFNPDYKDSGNLLASKAPKQDSNDVKAFKKNAGLGPKLTLSDAISDIINKGLSANIQSIKARWAEIKPWLEQGIFDKHLGIKLAEREILGDVAHSISGYVSARLSTGSSSTMSAILQHGAPKWINGIIQKKEGSKGLAEILIPVKGDLENFTAWMVAKRAKRLFKEGKENNFTEAQIKAGLSLKQKDYQKVVDDIAELNSSILDLAQESGLIDPASRKLFENNDYIPFYRIVEDKKTGPSNKRGASHQSSGIKMLKGGVNPLSDPLGNMMQNWAHLVDASMKNDSLDKTLTNLEGSRFIEARPRVDFKQALIPKEQIKKILKESGLPDEVADAMPAEVTTGIAKMWSIQAPTSPDVVRVMRNGKSEYFKVNDTMLLTSLTSVNQEQLGGIFEPMRYMKSLLTGAITAEPTFMARNFIRDSMHSWTIAEEKGFKLGVDSIHGAVKSFKEEGGYVDMMFAGASFQGGQGNYNQPESARESMDAALRKRGIKDIRGFKESILDTPKKYWEAYRAIGDAIENASREATLELSKKAGNEKAQYVFEAKDLMDFSMGGSFTLFRALGDMLPFFNARLIGLYRLSQAGKTKESAKMLAAKGASIAMMSVALLALNSDNDNYEALEDWDKDTYWHFFIGNHHFRMPKPFELGLIFGTIPERSARALIGKDSLGQFAARMGHGVTDTLAFNPVPQLFKPFVEIYSNKNMFTNRPIEGMGDKNKLPSGRYNEYTSETMRVLSDVLPEELGTSPKRLEHLVRGYFGSLGMYILGSSDMVVRGLSDMPPLPEGRIDRLPVIKAFYQEKPAMHTKYGTQFYDMLNEVNQIHSTINAYKKEGRFDKARELREDNLAKLRTRNKLTRTRKSMSRLRKQVDIVYRGDLSPAAKRVRIDLLMSRSNDVVKKAVKSTHPYFN